ncbi:hypothetical protein CES85_4178 [Ochrobactrum quorumnocens]|uniref:Uncharacterized protein n=1 Tax=Ochrobactrum quorumnocens TaxID=271865 RepID=A0A248U9M0_9HYPH|nr:hypothetical protein CES85_4178 [[Ochrobactrum] quorumnocens]
MSRSIAPMAFALVSFNYRHVRERQMNPFERDMLYSSMV